MLINAAEFFPILHNEDNFQAYYYAEDGSVHGWVGSFWDIAARGCTFIMNYEKGNNRLKTLLSKQLRGIPRVEIVRNNPSLGTPDDRPVTLLKDDYDNATRAYYQGSPEAAWFILYASLGTEEDMQLTQKGIETYIKATT